MCTNQKRFKAAILTVLTALVISFVFFTESAHPQGLSYETQLEVKLAVQGYFDAGIMQMRKDCEVEILLRDAIDPNIIWARKSAVIDKSTLTAFVSFRLMFIPECYISVKTPNSIETFSYETVLLRRNEVNKYDFTSSKEKAYGANMHELDLGGGKIACIYNGDVNSDGIVDVVDLALVEHDIINYVSGNVLTDVNGDEFVDISDFIIADRNAYDFVTAIFPSGSVFDSKESAGEQQSFRLGQNYPNPFNPSTKIGFKLSNSSDIRLSVFDISGRELEVLASGRMTPGEYSFSWNAASYASGTYFCRLTVNGIQSVKQMQLVK